MTLKTASEARIVCVVRFVTLEPIKTNELGFTFTRAAISSKIAFFETINFDCGRHWFTTARGQRFLIQRYHYVINKNIIVTLICPYLIPYRDIVFDSLHPLISNKDKHRNFQESKSRTVWYEVDQKAK